MIGGMLFLVLAVVPAAADEVGQSWESAVHPRCYLCHGPGTGAELVGMARARAERDQAVGEPLAEQVNRWHHDRPGFNLSVAEVAQILSEFGASAR